MPKNNEEDRLSLVQNSLSPSLSPPRYISPFRQTKEKQDEIFRRLGQKLLAVSSVSSNLPQTSYILSGVNKLPRYLNVHELPDDVRRNSVMKNSIISFYARETACECRIRNCSTVLSGFSNIMNHERDHDRIYSHMCIHEGCMVPFDKLGNAKRHELT